ncbi:CD40 ligand-like isoform X2 [Myxocyprinus asiaticus]|uniref:CD40 ligand-like isoform X2 n=1 Tax=Myxocyprinus asiaticus TaxID=70543 RepID=UPI0022224AC4|nr:CD40 ligand-like isoform X2 [Myxocyprinus asiaticus]
MSLLLSTYLLFTMINTFHTSYNPPPVPPRAGYSRPQPPGNTPLVKFLSVMLLLLMMLTFGGFLYLFQKLNVQQQLQGNYNEDLTILQRLQDCEDGNVGEDAMTDCNKLMDKYQAVIARISEATEKVAGLTGMPSFKRPAAHMILQNEHTAQSPDGSSSNKLKWDQDHSFLQDVWLSSSRDMLTIQYPGIYLIYSQVTFSKQSDSALTQAIKSKEPQGRRNEDKEMLRSFCNLNPNKSHLCTASLSGVFQLKKDQQLYVTVTNISLVNRDSCSFGLFKLQ